MVRLSSVAGAAICAIFSLVTIALPYAGAPESSKGILVLIVVALACISAAVALSVSWREGWPAVRLGLVPMTLLLLAGISTFRGGGLFGVTGRADEAMALTAIVIFVLCSLVGSVADPQRIGRYLDWYLIASALSGLLSMICHVFDPAFLGTETIAGTWMILGIVEGAALFIAAGQMTRGDRNPVVATGGVIAAVALLFFATTAVLASLAASAALYCAVVYRRDGEIPIGFLAIGIVALTLASFGPLGSNPPAEIRPSLQASSEVIAGSYQQSVANVMIGTGPGTLPATWNVYRPIHFNQSPLWAQPVPYAYSTAASFALEYGMLSVFILALLVIAIATSLFEADPRATALIAPAAIFVVLSIFVVPVSTLGLALAGLFYGLSTANAEKYPRSVSRAGILAASFIFFIVGMSGVYVGGRQLLGQYRYAAAEREIDRGTAALKYAAASHAWPAADYAVSASKAYADAASAQLDSGESSDAEEVRSLFAVAGTFADTAVRDEPKNYDALLWRASLYIDRGSLGDPTGFDAAEVSLKSAALIAPSRPEPAYYAALIKAFKGDSKGARESVTEALARKPDYSNALALMAKLRGSQ